MAQMEGEAVLVDLPCDIDIFEIICFCFSDGGENNRRASKSYQKVIDTIPYTIVRKNKGIFNS